MLNVFQIIKMVFSLTKTKTHTRFPTLLRCSNHHRFLLHQSSLSFNLYSMSIDKVYVCVLIVCCRNEGR
ncbi:hypothetical protein L6452_39758 [Arctium lappa]|uniref:Uncharacterized protein n=1 Tax=Arctium lappa TaxID=4217 RepID=A0ACB8XTE3_ARCLA|nr:hypothetical protein L6452_39758 [Arctium lappa]